MRIITHCTLLTMFITYSAFAGDKDKKMRQSGSLPLPLALLKQKLEPPRIRHDSRYTKKGCEVELVAEQELKLRTAKASVKYDFGPSVYPKQDASPEHIIDPVATITRKSWYEWGRWDFRDMLYGHDLPPDPREPGQEQITVVAKDDERQHLFMSSGERAVSASCWNDLNVHHWGPFEDDILRGNHDYAERAALADKQGSSHLKTSLPGHKPHFEFLCAVNPQCTRIITMEKDLTRCMLYDIAYRKNGGIENVSREDFTTEAELIPLYFDSEYTCIALGLFDEKTYRLNVQTLSEVSMHRLHNVPGRWQIEQVKLSFRDMGLAATLKMADDRLMSIDPASGKPEYIKLPRLRKDAADSDDD